MKPTPRDNLNPSPFSIRSSPCSFCVCSSKAPKDVSEKKLCDPTQDTEAYVAANEDVVLAVFRGTSEAADWITNLEIIPRNVDDSWSFEGDGGFVHMVRRA